MMLMASGKQILSKAPPVAVFCVAVTMISTLTQPEAMKSGIPDIALTILLLAPRAVISMDTEELPR
jgi:hypothetical protein